jgi:hypothetical protein
MRLENAWRMRRLYSMTDTRTHDTHDVLRFDGGWETRFWCRDCKRGWSEMRIAQYAREHDAEEATA